MAISQSINIRDSGLKLFVNHNMSSGRCFDPNSGKIQPISIRYSTCCQQDMRPRDFSLAISGLDLHCERCLLVFRRRDGVHCARQMHRDAIFLQNFQKTPRHVRILPRNKLLCPLDDSHIGPQTTKELPKLKADAWDFWPRRPLTNIDEYFICGNLLLTSIIQHNFEFFVAQEAGISHNNVHACCVQAFHTP
ncbi:hypothetical protein HG530_014088 [Fusarium avenaceum]|nr:hypothetical protein HG530_014088 [Fusarium avenaceum]